MHMHMHIHTAHAHYTAHTNVHLERSGVRCELGGCDGGLDVCRRHGSCGRKLGNRCGLSGRSSDRRSLGDGGIGLGLHHGRGGRGAGELRAERRCYRLGLEHRRIIREVQGNAFGLDHADGIGLSKVHGVLGFRVGARLVNGDANRWLARLARLGSRRDGRLDAHKHILEDLPSTGLRIELMGVARRWQHGGQGCERRGA
eukprot:scaffold12865_cov71-Phaeocystis_antarctica.AAC.1